MSVYLAEFLQLVFFSGIDNKSSVFEYDEMKAAYRISQERDKLKNTAVLGAQLL
jgi:hypothetical protein